MPSRRQIVLIVPLVVFSIYCGVALAQSGFTAPTLLPGDTTIAPAAGTQRSPQIASGGEGYLAVWMDNRTSLRNADVSGAYDGQGVGTVMDVYAARLDANGSVIDTTPIIISQAQYNQQSPRVGWNGQHWLVVWTTQRESNRFLYDLIGVRVAADGSVVDATPIVIHASQSSSDTPDPWSVASDGANWTIVWRGLNQEATSFTIFGTRVAPDGTVLDPDGKVLRRDGEDGYANQADLAFAGNEFLLVWDEDAPDGQCGAAGGGTAVIKGQRLTTALDPTGDSFIINLYCPSDAVSAKVASDGSGYFAVWSEERYDKREVFGARISHDGQVQDPNGIQLDDFAGFPQPVVAWDGTNWVIASSKSTESGEVIHVSRVSPAGVVLNPANVPVRSGVARQSQPAIASRGAGKTQLVWSENLPQGDIYGASVSTLGAITPNVPVSLGAPRHSKPRMAAGGDGFLSVYRSEISGTSRILAQRLDAAGNAIDDEPFTLAGGSVNNPSVAWNGSVYLVVWEESTARGQTFARRVAPDGTIMDTTPISIMPGIEPDVAALGDNFIVVNSDAPSNPHQRFTQSARVSGDGVVLDTPLKVGANFDRHPRVAAFGNRWLAVWEQNISHDNQRSRIVGAFIEASGTVSSKFSISDSGFDDVPHLAVAGTSAFVVWEDGDIYGRRIAADGTMLDPLAGIRISDAPNNQQFAPVVAWDGAQYVVTYVDNRDGAYPNHPRGDIYAARVTVTGVVLEELAVAASAVPEEHPFVATLNGTSVFSYVAFNGNAPYAALRTTLRTRQFDAPTTATAAPNAPTNLSAFDEGGGNVINLAWTDNSDDENGFRIESRVGDETAWTQIATIGANATSYTVAPVSTSLIYHFRVRAFNTFGDSVASNQATAANAPPTVTLTAPGNGASFPAPANITLSADAIDSNGTIQQVDFFAGTTRLATVTTAPYTATLANVAAGSFTFTARATDNRGATATSAPVTIKVNAPTNSLLISQNHDYQSIFGPSVESRTNATTNKEFADDFDIIGSVERVLVYGSRGFSAPSNPTVHGARVRFYEWTNGQPGAQLAEHYLTRGSANLNYNAVQPALIDITLPTAFQANGKHFVSVQLVVEGFDDYWYLLSANSGSPRGAGVHRRDNAAGGAWTQEQNSDASFALYGNLSSAARIDSLSQASATRSEYFKIFGANFGATQNGARVLVDDVPAIIARWSESEIIAYVPEAARLGASTVQIVAGAFTSNSLGLIVTERQATGRIRWRAKVAADYIQHRAAVAPDGTIYARASNGQLYAWSSTGALKWMLQAGEGGYGAVNVGADGTLYTAGQITGVNANSLAAAVIALNPDGSKKWQYVDPNSYNVNSGPNVGPDGKIYVIFAPDAESASLNLAALTPDGKLAWNRNDNYGRYGSSGKDLAFGKNVAQLYFATGSKSDAASLFGYDLDGTKKVVVSGVCCSTPTVAFDDSIHTQMQSFNAQGGVLWTLALNGQGPTSNQTVGPDNTHYVVQNYARLFAVNPNGTEKWVYQDSGILFDPVANPAGNSVFMGGRINYGYPGYFIAVNTTDGTPLWRIDLPVEAGFGEYGQVIPSSRPTFTTDGRTAYISTDVAGDERPNEYSFFYAVNTEPDATPGTYAPTVSITSPVSGATFPSLSDITFTANAADSDGTIARVEFYANNGGAQTLIGTDTTAPYSVVWNDVASSPVYGIYAIAYDDSGLRTTSETIGITVNTLPDVIITGSTEASVSAATPSITLTANAQDNDGSIVKVEFFSAEHELIGSDTSAPYNVNWNNAAPGIYNLIAKATDNFGGKSVSSVTFVVKAATPIALSPTADLWVQGATAFRDTNYGTSAEMQIKRTLNPGSGRGRRGFISFDTSSVTGSISSAKLRIYAKLSDASLAPTGMIVQKVTDTTWDETAMTWSNQPLTASPSALAQIVVTDATGRYYEFDLTAFIQQERAVGRTAVSLRLINLTPTGNSGAFFTSVNSKEAASNQPQLVVAPTTP